MSKFGVAAAFVLGGSVAWSAEWTVGPGETLDWDTVGETVATDTVTATGGTIVNLAGDVRCRFNVGGPVEVRLKEGATPRLYSKIGRTADDGRLIFFDTIRVGGQTGAFAFIDDDVIGFAPDAKPDANLVLAEPANDVISYTGCTTLPETWACGDRVVHGLRSVLVAFGADMAQGEECVMPAYAGSDGEVFLRMTADANFANSMRLRVPERSCLTFAPMSFDATKLAGSTLDSDTTYTLSNPIVMAGGRFKVSAGTPVVLKGDFSGSGTVEVEPTGYLANSKTDRSCQFRGSLTGLSSNSVFHLCSYDTSRNNRNFATRICTDFPGTIRIDGNCPSNTVSFGVMDHGKKTQQTYEFGRIESSGKVTVKGAQDFYGPLLQYNKYQRWKIGSLKGDVAVSPSRDPGNQCDLEIGKVENNSSIWIRYGIRLKIGQLGTGVKLHYVINQENSSNVVEVASGAFAEIEVWGGNTLILNNVSADAIIGDGRVEVVNGDCRFGVVEKAIKVDVKAGSVRFGSRAELSAVLGARPALWLDACDTDKMVGAWNAGWATSTATGGGAKVLAHCPKVAFNGQDTATYTNGFPLIEKWYDKRPEQTYTYGWQDRCTGYGSTLYTLVYPYLVPNGLNGKPYMSFGAHGTQDLDPNVYGLSRSASETASKQERRRMPLMHDMINKDTPSGNAIQARAVVMVFGSQQGGGRAIVGGYGTGASKLNDRWDPNTCKAKSPLCSSNYARGGSGYETTNAIFSTQYDTWVDGASVDPTKTGLGGGWNIISFQNSGAKAFRSLGMGKYFGEAGGQNYAELIAFTNVLSVAERQAVEEYLAYKWDLPLDTILDGNVTVEAGAKVSGTLAGVSGDGEWTTRDGCKVTVPSDFTGRLSGAGVVVSANAVGTTEGFTGSVTVTGETPTFTYAEGAFSNAMVAPEATLAFPSATAIALDFGETVPEVGEYVLVSAKTLTGLENVTVTGNCAKRAYVVRRVGNGLILYIDKIGSALIVR